MACDWSFLQKKSSHASRKLHSHHSWEDFLTIQFHQCLTLGRAGEYSHTTKALQPMTPIILSENIIITLRHLLPCPSNLVPPLIFYY
jgi:hypothetical protein